MGQRPCEFMILAHGGTYRFAVASKLSKLLEQIGTQMHNNNLGKIQNAKRILLHKRYAHSASQTLCAFCRCVKIQSAERIPSFKMGKFQMPTLAAILHIIVKSWVTQTLNMAETGAEGRNPSTPSSYRRKR